MNFSMSIRSAHTQPLLLTPAVRTGQRAFASPSTRRSQKHPMPRRACTVPRADLKRNFEGMARQGDRIADSVAGILPGSIPRGAAKTGILAVGGLIAFSLLQKIFSTFLFLGVIGGAAYLWLKLNSDKGSGGGGSGSNSNGEDPLSDARRIMDKYK